MAAAVAGPNPINQAVLPVQWTTTPPPPTTTTTTATQWHCLVVQFRAEEILVGAAGGELLLGWRRRFQTTWDYYIAMMTLYMVLCVHVSLWVV